MSYRLLKKKLGKRSKKHRFTLEQFLRKTLNKKKFLAVEFNGDKSLGTILGKNNLRIAYRRDGKRFVLIPLELLQSVPTSLSINFELKVSRKSKKR